MASMVQSLSERDQLVLQIMKRRAPFWAGPRTGSCNWRTPLTDIEAAEAHDPVLVHRLRRIRATARPAMAGGMTGTAMVTLEATCPTCGRRPSTRSAAGSQPMAA